MNCAVALAATFPGFGAGEASSLPTPTATGDGQNPRRNREEATGTWSILHTD